MAVSGSSITIAILLILFLAIVLVLIFVPWGKCGLTIGERANSAINSATNPPPAAASVDLSRYQGTWYEIARFPNPFEAPCQRDVMATYTLDTSSPTPRMKVVNSCVISGQNNTYSVDGIASPASGTNVSGYVVSPAKLDVSFSIANQKITQPYWILYVDDAYTQAIAGGPDRSLLWILSRSRSLSEQQYDLLVARAGVMGFDVSKLQKTTQN